MLLRMALFFLNYPVRISQKSCRATEAIYELDGYMDFEKYGQDCMENDCVTQTEFGLLRRLDPPFPEQRQGQRMM